MSRRAALALDLARGLAAAAAVFVLLMGGLLAWSHLGGKVPALVTSREVVQLHEELRKQPKNEELKVAIRHLDLRLRRVTFLNLQLSDHASRAALIGLAVFLGAAHFVRTQTRRPPDPLAWGTRAAAEETHATRRSRHAVSVSSALLGALAALAALRPLILPPPPDPAAAAATAQPDYPSAAEFAGQWPAFRGPHGAGVAAQATAPRTWDGTNGLNVRWKTPVPLPGMSSPIVWSNAIFLTGSDGKSNSILRFDTETGALVWSVPIRVPAPAGGELQVMEDTGHAAPTAVTDGRRVYAIFPNGEIAAFDFAGRQVWARQIGPLENAYGYASSLALYQDRLLVQIDRGTADEGLSRMQALDTRTGRDAWQARREVGGSWASPVVVELMGRPQLLTCGPPWFTAYDPTDGKVIWQAKCLESDTAPSPVCGSNVVVVVAPNNAIIGLRPGATSELWRAEDGVPDATSPLVIGEHVYILSSEGLLSCYALETGTVVWQHEFEDHFYASPTQAGGAIILLARKGAAYLLAPGEKFQELGRAHLGEPCNASPAPVGRRLYIRGQHHLFCIEEPEKS